MSPIVNNLIVEIDTLIKATPEQLADDDHARSWHAKERDWVDYYVHRYLMDQCSTDGPLKYSAKIGIEVGVPQPPKYQKLAVSRDLVIWSEIGGTCWDKDWNPQKHPLAILEWKVHRPGRRNLKVNKERAWLRDYCQWQQTAVAYAVEVHGDKSVYPLTCTRFLGMNEDNPRLNLRCS
jgi:hypothetical protein